MVHALGHRFSTRCNSRQKTSSIVPSCFRSWHDGFGRATISFWSRTSSVAIGHGVTRLRATTLQGSQEIASTTIVPTNTVAFASASSSCTGCRRRATLVGRGRRGGRQRYGYRSCTSRVRWSLCVVVVAPVLLVVTVVVVVGFLICRRIPVIFERVIDNFVGLEWTLPSEQGTTVMLVGRSVLGDMLLIGLHDFFELPFHRVVPHSFPC